MEPNNSLWAVSLMRGRRTEKSVGVYTIFFNNLLQKNFYKKFPDTTKIWTKAPIFLQDINNIHTNW